MGVRIPGVRRVGVDGVDDSPRLAAWRDAVSLLKAMEGEGDEGTEFGCDMRNIDVVMIVVESICNIYV